MREKEGGRGTGGVGGATCFATFTCHSLCHDSLNGVGQHSQPVVQHPFVPTDIHSIGFIVDGVSQQGEGLKGGVIVEDPHMEVHLEGRRGGRVGGLA